MKKKTVQPIEDNVYDDLAQEGARVLFDRWEYRLLDGWKGDKLSHFLLNTSTGALYLLSIDIAYELVTMHHHGNKDYLYDRLLDLESPFKQTAKN